MSTAGNAETDMSGTADDEDNIASSARLTPSKSGKKLNGAGIACWLRRVACVLPLRFASTAIMEPLFSSFLLNVNARMTAANGPTLPHECQPSRIHRYNRPTQQRAASRLVRSLRIIVARL